MIGGHKRRDATLRGLLTALTERIDLIVATHSAALPAVAQWIGGERGVRCIAIDDAVDFTWWSQDACLPAVGANGRPLMLLPATAAKQADKIVAAAVADEIGCDVQNTAFEFEGGNVLVGTDFVLAGADVGGIEFAHAMTEAGQAVRLLAIGNPLPGPSVRWLETADGPLVEEAFGHAGRRQPLFHLDGFVSLAGPGGDGRQRILVGDSRMAVRAVDNGRLPLNRQSLADELDEIATILASSPDVEVIRNPLVIAPLDDDGLFRWSRRTLQQRFADADGLEDILATFDRSGLHSVRVRRWRALTQNGVIVLGGAVLLPTYSASRPFLRPAELHNADIWRGLGFQVVELGDFTDFAADNGSPHCLFKPLR